MSRVRRETVRYMGYRNAVPDESIMQLMEECIEEILLIARPKSTNRRFALTLHDNEIEVPGLKMKSVSLGKNLKDCEEVFFFAATLGMEVDRCLAKYSRLRISKAAVFQAAATAILEEYCDECQRDLEVKMLKEGRYLRPRFSPGYGDLRIGIQADFLRMLDAARTVGIHLSDGGAMIPEKSVSALIGISKTNTRCHKEGCESCPKTDCVYRR